MFTSRAFFFLICLLCFSLYDVGARPTVVEGRSCKHIDRRKEWRDLPVETRLGYLNAVHCLHSLPPHDKTRAATTRYEEFQATHILLTDRIHSVGHFLSWHRHLIALYGKALREECGYDGPTAYWDWSRDADADVDLADSPIFDPVTGFGGDGVPGTWTFPPGAENDTSIFPPPSQGAPPGFPTMDKMYRGCVQDGPFSEAKWRIHVGPGRLVAEHCLVRGFNRFILGMITGAAVQRVMQSKDFEEFRRVIDGLLPGGPIHGGGHALVGGEMTNIYSAGADPLFYMHHAGLDKVWWDWQQADPENRMYDITGPTTVNGSIPITLDFELDFPALGPNITVRDTLDSSLEPNCFTYE